MASKPIYVEIRIHAPLDDLWKRTQTPELHQKWDLRFTRIDYLPRSDPSQPQRFLYETRIGFGLRIRGEGETVGESDSGAGPRASALKFSSADPKSLIRDGSGYWKYAPTDDGIRFLTSYDYSVRYGPLGRFVDALAFRPLLGWATAWSFDRLRLWLEKGVDPAGALARSAAHAASRLSLAFIWIYHGIVPKLLAPHTGELEIARRTGFLPGREALLVQIAGWGEVLFGAALLLTWRHPALLWLTLAFLPFLSIAAWKADPGLYLLPFNPASLIAAMAGLSAAALACSRDLPTASRCLRRPP